MFTEKIVILLIRKGVEIVGLTFLDGYWTVLYGETWVKAIFPNASISSKSPQ